MKPACALLFAASIAAPAAAQETNWGRIGQSANNIVDVDLASIKRSGDTIHAMARFLPRSSKADPKVMNKNVKTMEPAPTFFKQVTADYQCKEGRIAGHKDEDFDTNFNITFTQKNADGWKAYDEYKLVLDFVCAFKK